MNKEKWIQMPHPAHLCVANYCRFHLATYVGKYIVSTVGEYRPERAIMEEFGFEEIGTGRKYETMVFRAVKSKNKCCPYKILVNEEVDMKGYNDADSATIGHNLLCKKWSKRLKEGK